MKRGATILGRGMFLGVFLIGLWNVLICVKDGMWLHSLDAVTVNMRSPSWLRVCGIVRRKGPLEERTLGRDGLWHERLSSIYTVIWLRKSLKTNSRILTRSLSLLGNQCRDLSRGLSLDVDRVNLIIYVAALPKYIGNRLDVEWEHCCNRRTLSNLDKRDLLVLIDIYMFQSK